MLNKPSLVNRDSVDMVDIDHIGIKFVGMVVFGIITSFVAGITLLNLVQGVSTNLMYVLLLISFGLFASTLIFQSLLIKSWKLGSLIIFLELIALCLPFYKQLISAASFTALGILGLIFIYFFWGYAKGTSEHQNSLRIKFFGVAKPVLTKSATAISLFVVFVYFFLFGFNNLTITPAWVDMILSPTTTFVNYYLPGFNPRASVNDVLGSFAKKQIEGMNSENDGGGADKTQIVNQAVRDIRKQISDFVDIKVTGNETVNELLSSIFNKFSAKARETSNQFVLGGAALLLFLIVRTTAPIINFFVSILAYVFYEFLLMVSFIHTPSENRPKEIVNFKHES